MTLNLTPCLSRSAKIEISSGKFWGVHFLLEFASDGEVPIESDGLSIFSPNLGIFSWGPKA